MARLDRTWTFPDGAAWDLTERTRIAGVLNLTSDSFSDGGRYLDLDAAVAHGLRLAEEGADLIDVGGESTRPGAEPVPESVERERVVPVIRALRARLPRQVRISVDTYKSAIAEEALRAGAEIVNDVSSLRRDPAMAAVLVRTGAAAILMHMRGTPATMQNDPVYENLIEEIASELTSARNRAREAGVRDDRIVLDPGIGFGKTAEHNFEILARLSRLASMGRPLMVGASRKSFLGKVTGLDVDQRLEASLAAGAVAIMNGADLLRVHDVGATVRMSRVVDAVRRISEPSAE